MEKLAVSTTQVHIFAPDVIPLASVSRERGYAALESAFSAAREKVPFFLPGIDLVPTIVNGEIEVDGESFLVDRIRIEDRRILITTSGPTEVTEATLGKLLTVFREVDLQHGRPIDVPILTTDEAHIDVRLTHGMDALIGGRFGTEIPSVLDSRLPHHNAEISVVPSSVRFRISFSRLPERLRRNRITLSDKVFALELKEKTDPADCIYTVTAPTDSATLLAILDEVEKLSG